MIEQNCQKLNKSAGTSKGKKSYTVKEITKILGISPSSAAKLIKANMFQSVRVGREVRIPKSDFDTWLDNKSKGVNQYGINSKKKK